MRDDYQRLLDIREGIERIEKYTATDKEKFETNELVQTWVLHHLQIVSEAARALSAECKAQQPQVPWEKINGMRNILVHHYFGIDTEIVWAAVEKDLPGLKQAIAELIERNKPKEEAS
jgi:uncharacterized protein with HEPN domain